MSLSQKVIYQIYPKSFYDSDGDGIGDLRGIIQKIPYIAKLHVDMIWFNPFFISPQNDNGYDIANYYQIDPTFGTMHDFEELVAKLKAIHVGVMLDMVFNHTSTSHPWFQRALAGNKRYQKYYYLRPAKSDGSLPTNWESKFGGPAWERFGKTDQYYLHLYDVSQADLDWHNPDVRQECYQVVNFWRRKGVQGFRFDVINVIGKDENLVDAKVGEASKLLYTDKPVVHDYLQEMNAETFGQDPDSVTVGEMSSTTVENSVKYTNPDNHELSMVFNFHHLKTDYDHGEKWSDVPFDFPRLKELLDGWANGMAAHGWQALFWNNHDQPRATDRFGDVQSFRVKSAEMLATVIHLLRGTPFIYMGEEIGMVNPDYDSIHDYVDVEALNAYHELIDDEQMSPEDAFHLVQIKARDNSRTPMQWDDSENAGFTTGTPWLEPTNQKEINVENELAHGEIFNYYQQLIHLRKTLSIVSDGGYQSFLMDHPQVFGYLRTNGHERLAVYNNFYGETTTVDLPAEFVGAKVLISNYPVTDVPAKLTLQPYQSVALFHK